MSGERQREAIVAALRAAPGGHDARALGRLLGLHPNTVRWHLGNLDDAGLVHGEPERRHGPGRPRVVYRLTADGIARGRDEYRLLATMLTEAADEERAYETGRRWGAHLHQPGEGIAELMDAQGFAAEQVDETIAMRRCPFYALAETHPEIVCTLHRGIMDGARAESGCPARVRSLEPFVEPSLCVARLS